MNQPKPQDNNWNYDLEAELHQWFFKKYNQEVTLLIADVIRKAMTEQRQQTIRECIEALPKDEPSMPQSEESYWDKGVACCKDILEKI